LGIAFLTVKKGVDFIIKVDFNSVVFGWYIENIILVISKLLSVVAVLICLPHISSVFVVAGLIQTLFDVWINIEKL
jgi:hypothetical protein